MTTEAVQESAPPPPAPKKPDPPPSRYDTAPPKGQETFDRVYVDELRSENHTWRDKLMQERQQRETAEKERDEAKVIGEAAKKPADADATAKVIAAEQRANERIVFAKLEVAAIKAGMIDLDGLKLADVSKVTLEDDGSVKGADELMVALKEAKPYLFGVPNKGTSNTNHPPPPGDTQPKKAKDMSPAEQDAFLRDHKKKFG